MKTTTKGDLMGWVDALSGTFTLIAPKLVEQRTLYRPVNHSSEIAFDFTRTDLPAKELFLPATQTLFSVHKSEQGYSVEEPPPAKQRVVFGLRPCDARALRVLDALFVEREPVDPYYAGRRESTTLIGLACREMGEGCFCTSLGLAPDDAQDVDLMLTESDGGYAVQVVTGKGWALLDALPVEEVEGTLPRPALVANTPVLGPAEWPRRFDDPYWARLADRCLSCRVCAYVCPTCRCFDVRDHERGNGDFQRLCAWDSCMAEGYRRIAGGHNPRPTKAERLRNRFYCKFCYYAQDFGPVACVGCGRCIGKCPVNVDIQEVLADVAAL